MRTIRFKSDATFRILLGCVVLMFAVVSLAAQAPPGQGEFVPVDQLPPTEQLPAAPLLIAAYAFVWLATAVYVWVVWRRLGRVEREMHDLVRRRSQGTSR
jgi:CcmD family protein